MLKRTLLVITILLSCVGCDQASKSVATSHLSEGQTVSHLVGTVRLQVAKNYGAFLGLGTSLGKRTQLVSIGTAIGLVALLIYCLAFAPANPVTLSALALILGGGISNLIDRLLYGGYVIDFLNVGIGPLRTGIFNLADVFIMLGFVLLLFRDRLYKALPTDRTKARSR